MDAGGRESFGVKNCVKPSVRGPHVFLQAYLVKNPAYFGPLVLENESETRRPTQGAVISVTRA